MDKYPPDGYNIYWLFTNRIARKEMLPCGQGPDKGTLGGQPMLHVSIDKENTITHFLAGPLPEGSTVAGHVDWAQRFDYMQQHTGEHILSGLVHRHFGYSNVGFHLGAGVTTLDFDGPLSMADIRRMEGLANEAVIANLPVNISFPSPAELAALQYRSKLELTGAACRSRIPSAGGIGRQTGTDPPFFFQSPWTRRLSATPSTS